MGFLPTGYKSASESTPKAINERYFECKHLNDGDSVTLRPCGTFDSGHVIAGFSYFTMEGQPRRFADYPVNYLDDIGLTYKAKQSGGDERDKPKYFLAFTALCKERDDFVCVTLDKKTVREQLEEVLAMEPYDFLPSGMANFYVTLKRKGEGMDTSYTLVPALKAPSKAEEKRWADAKDGIWLPALYSNADPFAGKPSEGEPVGLPPTARDEYGADTEVATAATGAAAGW